ncbi:hypothetical protein BDZ89DRAFT_1166970 [Hymenopellis radicata]|nr:hypothetical protein BDZ89DRAFT_1166970 [Hymenopellis radicata]
MDAIELCRACHHTFPAWSFPASAWEGCNLRACTMPSDADRTVIQGRIENIDAEAAAITAEIAYHRRLIRTLTTRRKQLKKYVARATPYIAPSAIRRVMLPPEVYRLIFQFACSDPIVNGDNSAQKRPVPVWSPYSPSRSAFSPGPYSPPFHSSAFGSSSSGSPIYAPTFPDFPLSPLLLPSVARPKITARVGRSPETAPARVLTDAADDSELFELDDESPLDALSSKALHNYTPLSISSVCHFWRQIAVGLPELWSCIRVDRITRPDVVCLYLTRSKDHPLTLDLRTAASSVLLPLLAASHRWKAVNFEAPDFDLGDSTFPILEVVAVEMSPASEFPYWTDSSQLPVLHTLRMHGSPAEADLQIPWEQMSHVVATSFTPFFEFTPTEDGFSLRNAELAIEDTLSKGPIFPGCKLRITSLVLCASTRDGLFLSNLKRLELPLLNNLDISIPPYMCTADPSWISVFASVLRKSKCSIMSLRLKMPDAVKSQPVGADLYTLLDECKSLRSLTVIEGVPCILTDDFVDNLLSVGRDGESAYLPRLTEVELVWAERPRSKNRSIAAYGLLQHLPKRVAFGGAAAQNGVEPLEKVVLGVRDGLGVQPELSALLADLRRSGVQATLW